MNECKNCKMPVGISCCFNCGRDSSKCGVWHDCGKNCPGWEKRIKGDLISRKALLKEYEWLMAQTSDCNKPVLQEHIDRINRQPTVDAVEVVRCKDCAHSAIDAKTGQMMCALNGEIKPDGRIWYGTAVDEMHFCGYGETPDERQQRELAEQDAYEQLCNLGNHEDGSM